MISIRRALLSVSNKSGLIEFASTLQDNGVELLSTGGTASCLREAGLKVIDVSEYTGSPEILEGRVKTLHPKIHGGLLGVRSKPGHLAQMEEHGILPIDLVAVNLYPFRETASRENATFEEVVEQIDIGGPSMVRSAAKNHAFVAVITDPSDYGWIVEELKAHQCFLSASSRFRLAQKAFAHTAAYDAAIAAWLLEREWSREGIKKVASSLSPFEFLTLEKSRDLRYGENPHQRGALYTPSSTIPSGVAGAEVLHGRELSYNNLLDSDSAWNLVLEFELPAAAVIKHTNPSGAAQADSLCEAYVLARDCDPVSAFGSVVALNRPVDTQTAAELHATFVEVIIAPEFSAGALDLLTQKRNLRLLRASTKRSPYLEHRQISGGFLVQDRDYYRLRPEDLRVVTKRSPSDQELKALLFGWSVVKHVKSNAIVYSNSFRTLGIGAGQMSRVDSVKWGASRARLPLDGSALASDAFFPFPDGVEIAAGYGVRSIIQPGGSIRDSEVVTTADAHDIAMVFTGIRHFKH